MLQDYITLTWYPHFCYTMQIKISMKWPAHSYEILITNMIVPALKVYLNPSFYF